MTQQIILAVTLIGMALVAIPFIATVRSSPGSTPPASWLTEVARRQLVWALSGLGFIVTVASLWVWPHGARAALDGQVINATAQQWSWEIDKARIVAGMPVTFNVHSGDVNHGMGVTDANNRLLFQVQAMPGYVNRVHFTFEKTGIYRVICLEFCGIGHHGMLDKITVIAGNN